MTKRFSVPLLLIALGLFWNPLSQAAEPAKEPSTIVVLSWFKMNRAQFGCYLQKTFGVRDGKWNCNHKAYKSVGDPCKNTKAYYAGPSFPEKLVKKVNPRLRDVELTWEHGDLQAVYLDFVDKVSDTEARKMFGLPKKGAPDGFVSVDLQDCHKDYTCLIIQNFDHMGAGDVDCDG
jgi:hypothetical protein